MSEFEKAIRMKLRFPYKGWCSTEDLWDLNVRELDSIFKTLNRQRKAVGEDSLLDTKSPEDAVLALQLEIVRHVVKVKQAEALALLDAANRKMQKEKLTALLQEKQEEGLRQLPAEDLQKMIDEL